MHAAFCFDSQIGVDMQEDEKFEYADAIRIENLVKNYSQFISFPIYTWQEKTREKEVWLGMCAFFSIIRFGPF